MAERMNAERRLNESIKAAEQNLSLCSALLEDSLKHTSSEKSSGEKSRCTLLANDAHTAEERSINKQCAVLVGKSARI